MWDGWMEEWKRVVVGMNGGMEGREGWMVGEVELFLVFWTGCWRWRVGRSPQQKKNETGEINDPTCARTSCRSAWCVLELLLELLGQS